MHSVFPYSVIFVAASAASWTDTFQAWGSIVSAAIAGFSLIASVSLYFVGKHNDRIAQERNDARRISVWGVESSENGYCGALIRNGCPYPAEYFSLTQDGNGQKLRVNILPPGTWFSRKNEDNCWEDCFPVIKDESAPSGYAIEKEDKRFALKNTITDQHGKPLHFYWEFALNEKGKWTNENGDLTFVNRRTISCLVIELTRIHNENGKASRNVCSKEHRHR